MFTIRVASGGEVVEEATRQLAAAGVTDGAIVSMIGAIDSCCITNMPADDASSDVPTEFHEPFELSGTGEVVDGRPHLHCTLGTEDNRALAGHLRWARVETWFVNLYVVPADQPAVPPAPRESPEGTAVPSR